MRNCIQKLADVFLDKTILSFYNGRDRAGLVLNRA